MAVDLSLLNYYKDLYSGHKIIYVRFLDMDFIFRTLTRKEYKYILQSSSNQYEKEDNICNASCLYPEDFDFGECGFAGINEFVAARIEKESGFQDIRDVLNEYKYAKQFNNLEIQCMDLIKAFIPEYTYEEMEEWTWQKLMEMTARAERIAELKGFDWHIQDQSEEYFKEMENIRSDNEEFIKQLQNDGVDPMFYFEDEIKETFQSPIIDFPIILGQSWNDEVVLDVVRKQIKKKNDWTKTRPNL